MEEYIHYITNIAVDAERPLQPVYGIVPTEPLEERIAPDLAGFRGMGPVRVGNQAAEQLQHDAYGSVILGASQMFIDERLPRMGDAALFRRLEPLGHAGAALCLEPDAGPWEYRGRQRIHTHSATMCWVACDRLARIAAAWGSPTGPATGAAQADKLREEILERAWNEQVGRPRRRARPRRARRQRPAAARARPAAGHRRALSCAPAASSARSSNRNGFIMRYTADDDFGPPETAFLVCQFWYIDALAALGREGGGARALHRPALAPQRVRPPRRRTSIR